MHGLNPYSEIFIFLLFFIFVFACTRCQEYLNISDIELDVQDLRNFVLFCVCQVDRMLFMNGSVLSRFSTITGFPNLRYSFVIFFFKDVNTVFSTRSTLFFCRFSNPNLILSIRLPVSTAFRINLAIGHKNIFNIVIPPF